MKVFVLSVAAVAAAAVNASAAIDFDQNVFPEAIFGSGNANGAFTTFSGNNLELGLRGKLRYDLNNQPQNTFNSNGAGTYTFQARSPLGAGNPRPEWNVEWHINTDLDGQQGRDLADLNYEIGMDNDPSSAVNFVTFDLINDPSVTIPLIGPVVAWDHALGDNATANGGGVADPLTYASNLAEFNVAQNSWAVTFNNQNWNTHYAGFNPEAVGEYTFFLAAFDSGVELGRTEIIIKVVPAPGAAGLLGIAGLAAARRRR